MVYPDVVQLYISMATCTLHVDIPRPKRNFRHWTRVRTYGTCVFAMDMLSFIAQAGRDKSVKTMLFYRVFIQVLTRFLPDFLIDETQCVEFF